VLAVGATASCSGTAGGGGAGARPAADPCRVPPGRAAADAILAPATWVPLVLALALQLGNADAELSGWAARETPVFGSTEAAKDMSDVLYWTTVAGYGVTALATLGSSGAKDCRVNLLRRVAVGAAAHSATSGATDVLKNASGRRRPDGSNDKSMPSGHSSGAAVAATLASRNLDWSALSERPAGMARGVLALAAAGTAWARVEGERHYPSDVLVGMSLGHFIGALASDSLLGRASGAHPEVALWHTGRGSGLHLYWTF
jgi:membrane-associated phospholipid phosphatase